MSAGEHGRWAVVTPKAPMRGRTPLETGLQMLLRQNFYRQRAPRTGVPAGMSALCPDEIFRRRFTPGTGCALSGQFVVILQWARIVTESQSGTTSGGKSLLPPSIS